MSVSCSLKTAFNLGLTGVGCALVMAAVFCMASMPAAGQVAATIDIDTATTTPLHPGFSGVNDEVSFPVEYWDYRFNALAANVGYGWVRFPGGNSGMAYSWQSGEDVGSWLAQFAADTTGPTQQSIKQLAGKGGSRMIDAANRANLLSATFVVCVNGFTDTPQSIGQLAAYAKANQIPVTVWELANEAYLYPDFFPTATDYLDKMKPYRDAIKAADPNAIVAVFVRDPSATPNAQNPWDAAIAAYPNKYWDAIAYHHYPPFSTGPFAQWMADETAVLVTKTTSLVTNRWVPIGPPGVRFLTSEFDPTLPVNGTTGAVSLTDGTLWGGIYVAEYIMRMSTLPSMMLAGAHSIVSVSGVLSASEHYGDVTAAANAGKTIDTSTLDFGFYLAAQANGLAVLNSAINRATQSNKTTLIGGATVAATGVTGGTPALYATSYTNNTGTLFLMITNKSATPHQATIRVNGSAATGTFPLQFVTGTDPSVANTPANPNAVAIQTGTSGNPVTVPPYSVLRVDVTTPAVAVVVNSASFQPGPVAPQELVSAFGAGFASQAIVAPAGQSFPAVLGDTTITISDSAGVTQPAPLYYVSRNQASFLIPPGVAAGAASLKVMRSGSTVLTASLTVSAVSPGLYSQNGNGAGVAAAAYVRASAPTAAAFVFSCQAGVALSCLSTPISLGAATDTVYVMLYGTGVRGAKNTQVYVAGQSVPLLYAGAQGQYQGLDQINFSLPRSLAGMGEASVYVVADGKPSNMTTINLK